MSRHFFAVFVFFSIAFAPFCVSSFEQVQTQPQKSLQQLLQGNERYTQDKLLHPNISSMRREALSDTQSPFAIIVGCSDSRVPPELVFDQGIGDLFVVRVAGNIVGPIETSSVEFAALTFGSSLIFVLGHENCGAVRAVLDNQAQDFEPIASRIAPALKDETPLAKNPLEQAIKANVRAVVKQLRSNPIISKLMSEKRIDVTGGYYHLVSGKVELCCDP